MVNCVTRTETMATEKDPLAFLRAGFRIVRTAVKFTLCATLKNEMVTFDGGGEFVEGCVPLDSLHLEELHSDTSEHELQQRGDDHDVADGSDGHEHALNHVLQRVFILSTDAWDTHVRSVILEGVSP